MSKLKIKILGQNGFYGEDLRFLEYQQNKFSLQFYPDKIPNLHHIRSVDFGLMSADLIWCKLGDFNQDKTAA